MSDVMYCKGRATRKVKLSGLSESVKPNTAEIVICEESHGRTRSSIRAKCLTL